jgi:hypothetical protein
MRGISQNKKYLQLQVQFAGLNIVYFYQVVDMPGD